MPWKVDGKDQSGYRIVRADTGKVVGHSTSKGKAEASVRARYANTKNEKFSEAKKPIRNMSQHVKKIVDNFQDEVETGDGK